MSRRILATAAVLLAFACASTGAGPTSSTRPATQRADDDRLLDRARFLREAEQRFPSGAHLLGYGVGDTPEEAEERARVDAARFIRSQIEANLRTLMEESTLTGSSVSVSSEIVDRVQSDAGELIRPVRELTRSAQGRYEAIAVARRAELDEKYAAQTESLAERLSLIYDSLLASGASELAVSAALCKAQPLEDEVERLDLERRLVTRRTAWTPELKDKRTRIRALRQQRRAAMQVSVVRSQSSSGLEITDAVLRQLGSAGYAAKAVDQARCTSGDGLLVDVNVTESCGDTPIGGVRCEVVIASSGTPCPGSGKVFTVSSQPARALHQNNEAIALRAAARKVDVDHFTRELAERLLAALGEQCR